MTPLEEAKLARQVLLDLAQWGDDTQDQYYWGYDEISARIREYADEHYPLPPVIDGKEEAR